MPPEILDDVGEPLYGKGAIVREEVERLEAADDRKVSREVLRNYGLTRSGVSNTLSTIMAGRAGIKTRSSRAKRVARDLARLDSN